MAAPIVAASMGAGRCEEARTRINETLSLCNALGLLGMLLLMFEPRWMLRLVLSSDAAAMDVAVPYLRFRALSLIPQLITATCAAAFRGTLDTRTPLLVSLCSSSIKLILDPYFIFSSGLGAAGATFSTLVAEMFAGSLNFFLLMRRNLVDATHTIQLPKKEAVTFLLSDGCVMMVRQIAINVCTLASSKYALAVDQRGTAAAAYGIVMQMYTCGFVVHVAMQGAAAAIIPATLAKEGKKSAQAVANRLFQWGFFTGLILGVTQAVVTPFLVPFFTPLQDVQKSIQAPAMVAAVLHVVNGPRFVGEGAMMGLGSFSHLTAITVVGMSLLVAALQSPLGTSLWGVKLCNVIFCSYQTIALLCHHYFFGALRAGSSEEEKLHDN